MQSREPVNSEFAKTLDTNGLRQHFLIEEMFGNDRLQLTYSHIDRIIVGGCMPVTGTVALDSVRIDGAEYFLERREIGVINIGGSGSVSIDGEITGVGPREAVYIGMGAKEVLFTSDDAGNPAKFYVNSVPAHRALPVKHITQADASPETLGDPKTSNRRTIYKYIVPDVVETCQLLMGLTELEAGSIWNTMPCHTHERRMEVYFYFDIPDDNVVFHFMGKPDETRHLVVRNEQAVISPSWSMHSGVGTANYTFIWGMAGENQVFSDMDFVPMTDLR